MLAYIVRRLVYGLVTLLALSIVVFTLLQFAGNPLDRLKLNPRNSARLPPVSDPALGTRPGTMAFNTSRGCRTLSPPSRSASVAGSLSPVAGFTALYVGLVGFVFNIRQAWWRPFKLTQGSSCWSSVDGPSFVGSISL